MREPPLDASEIKALVPSQIEIRPPPTSEAIITTFELFGLQVLCSHYCLLHVIRKTFLEKHCFEVWHGFFWLRMSTIWYYSEKSRKMAGVSN